MAVLIEASSVVVSRAAIIDRFAGGWDAFVATVPHGAFAHDDDLACIAFMDTADSEAYRETLLGRGLGPQHVAIVQQVVGPQGNIPWLKFANVEMHGMKVSMCWLTGSEPRTMCAPGHWKYEGSLSQNPNFVPTGAVGDRLKYLRNEKGVDVYYDMQADKEVYVGRPVINGDTPRALQTQIESLLKEALAIDAQGPVPRPRLFGRSNPRYKRLKRQLLPAIQAIVEGAGTKLMAAQFTYAVVLRMLGRLRETEQALRTANKLQPGNVGVLRDLVHLLGEQNRAAEALPFAREAVTLEPADPSVLGNLAAALLQCGNLDDALAMVNRALEIDPSDQINQHVRRTILKQRRPR